MTPKRHTRIPAPGPLRGVKHDGRRSWRGITFGRIEPGHGRWRPPTPEPTWTEQRVADAYQPPALQPVYSWQDRTTGTEDCLTLDIVRPNTDETLPVVVYFHGGSFILGASHQAILRGHQFVTDLNVVYVSINFRLGVFGYLDLTSLADNDPTTTANPALHDQILALQWVRDNIHAFGGDPGNVTIMGESAGGAAVLTLMACEQAHGLFHKAIAQSAPAATFHHRTQAAFWAKSLLEHMALPAGTPLDMLREEPAGDLVRAGQSMLWRNPSFGQLNSAFGPAREEGLLPQHTLKTFKAGHSAPVPLLIGTNNDEASFAKLFYMRKAPRSARALTMLKAYDPEHAPRVLEAYRGARTRQDFAQLITDAVFWAPSVRIAQNHALAGNPTWMYRYDYASMLMRRIGMGATHSMELAHIFNDAAASRISTVHRMGDEGQAEQVKELMQWHWGHFIHHGVPGPDWPHYHPDTDRATLIVDTPHSIAYDPGKVMRCAWQDYRMTEWGRGQQRFTTDGVTMDNTIGFS
ncbi:carboxylesterase/lipase family protein [Corynebacterium aquilae]|uniref:carboxylesterase/lipase family protein n=1 Tax=Corynebacterium aquilae TaxID=203263 RepID=UPI000950EA16|nr:carboxylesterase/lipase family protein [Corynebacterium aquilae]